MSALCPHNISRGIYISFSSRLSADIVRTYISRDICPHYILLRFSPLVVHLLLDAGLKPNSVLTINYQITPYLSSYLSCQNMYFITIFIKTPLHPPPMCDTGTNMNFIHIHHMNVFINIHRNADKKMNIQSPNTCILIEPPNIS